MADRIHAAKKAVGNLWWRAGADRVKQAIATGKSKIIGVSFIAALTAR